MKRILFYRVNDEYGCFSNFSHHPVLVGGRFYKTVEHFFQASKFSDYEVRDKIMNLDSPMKAAFEGRSRKNALKGDWEDIKDNIMFIALRAKFLQHLDIQKILLETGNAIIVEHTKNDSYWADGGDGTGKNMLGVLLMKVREEIRKMKYVDNLILPPWIVFPSVSSEDLFWRMGAGESFLMKWFTCFQEIDQKTYMQKFPEPDNWRGFYDE